MQYSLGFSLIELMIVVAIIGILVSLAAPSYQNYTRRAHYAEIVQAASPYKIGVEECYQNSGELNGCDAGSTAIPEAVGLNSKLIDQIEVRAGVIHIIPKNSQGIEPEDDYWLTPEVYSSGLNWRASGGGVKRGYAR